MTTKKKATSDGTPAKTPGTPATETDSTAGSGPGKGKKECPKCHTTNGAATRKCTNCGFVFASKKTTKKKTAKKASRIGAGSLDWGDAVNTKVQAAVKYIEQVGSIEEAKRVLELVQGLEPKA